MELFPPSPVIGHAIVLSATILVGSGINPSATALVSDGATVSGTIQVTQASIRSDGAKHDRDVVVELRPLEPVAVSEEARASMDQRGLVFEPHVLAVQRGTTVTFLNSDQEKHNVYFLDDRTGETLDIGTWGPGVSVDHRFTDTGTMITLCKLHLEMAAYVVVTEGPWFTIVQLDPQTRSATFSLDGVPAGSYRLILWHKKLKQKGGAVTVTVSPGEIHPVDAVLTKARFAGGR